MQTSTQPVQKHVQGGITIDQIRMVGDENAQKQYTGDLLFQKVS